MTAIDAAATHAIRALPRPYHDLYERTRVRLDVVVEPVSAVPYPRRGPVDRAIP